MNKVVIIISFFIIFQSELYSQKIDLETVELKYTQLPLVPVPNGTSTYLVKYNNAHESEVKSAESSYEEEKQDAQDEVDNEHQAVKIINAIGGNSTKPRAVEKPYLPIIYTDANVNQSFTLNELAISDNPDVILNINFGGFNYTKTLSTSTKSEVKYYSYLVKGKHEISISLTDNSGNVISEFDVPFCTKTTSASSKSFKSVSALDNYWAKSKHDVLRPLERKVTDKNLKNAQKEMINQFGISEQTKKIKVAVVRDKKVDYSEYEKAYELVFEGAMLYFDDNENAKTSISKALELWETALKESNTKDKKARINEKVTAATRYNCVMFYCWVNDHNKANYHLMKLKLLDVSKYNRQMKELKAFVDDHKARYEANAKI